MTNATIFNYILGLQNSFCVLLKKMLSSKKILKNVNTEILTRKSPFYICYMG